MSRRAWIASLAVAVLVVCALMWGWLPTSGAPVAFDGTPDDRAAMPSETMEPEAMLSGRAMEAPHDRQQDASPSNLDGASLPTREEDHSRGTHQIRVLGPDGGLSKGVRFKLAYKSRGGQLNWESHIGYAVQGVILLSPEEYGGRVRLEVHSAVKGSLVTGLMWDETSGPPSLIKLSRGRLIRGHVLAPDRTPVVGAHITAQGVHPQPLPFNRFDRSQEGTRTNDDGVFTLLAPGGEELLVEAVDAADKQISAEVRVASGAQDIEIVLPKRVDLVVRVLTSDGAPYEQGGAVTYYTTNPDELGGYARRVSEQSEIGEDGLAVVKQVMESRPVWIQADLGAQARDVSPAVRPVLPADGEATIRLARGFVLRGKVLGPRGEMISRPGVVLEGIGLEFRGWLRGDAEGKFQFGPLRAGRYRVRAGNAPSHASSVWREVSLPAPDIRLKLATAFVLRGAIDAATGGTKIHWTGAGHSIAGYIRDGEYVIEGVPDVPGALHAVDHKSYCAVAPVLSPRHRGPALATERGAGVEVALMPPASRKVPSGGWALYLRRVTQVIILDGQIEIPIRYRRAPHALYCVMPKGAYRVEWRLRETGALIDAKDGVRAGDSIQLTWRD